VAFINEYFLLMINLNLKTHVNQLNCNCYSSMHECYIWLNTWPFWLKGENTIKKAKGTKLKVLFQRLHCTWHVLFLCWFMTSNFVFWVSHLTLHFRYKHILITNGFYIKYIMHSCTLNMKFFIKDTFPKSIIFRVKSTFEPNVLKSIIQTIFISSSLFVFLIINIKILSNF
jgi:hypothetical protein